MLRKASEAVSEGNGPVRQEEIGFGQLALADIDREIWSLSKQQQMRCLDQLSEEMKMDHQHLARQEQDARQSRLALEADGQASQLSEEMKMDQHLARLEQDARQSRLAMEADGQASTKTRERTEGAATAAQAMRGDCSSARRVEPGPTNSTSFGMKAEPPALPCRDDSVVECGVAAFKSCLPSMEMRPSTAAGGLVPTGNASKASETTLNEPTSSVLLDRGNRSEGGKSMDFNSIRLIRQQQRLPREEPVCYSILPERVADTKSGQSRTFDPGGSRGHLRACPFLGSWRALVCGEV